MSLEIKGATRVKEKEVYWGSGGEKKNGCTLGGHNFSREGL